MLSLTALFIILAVSSIVPETLADKFGSCCSIAKCHWAQYACNLDPKCRQTCSIECRSSVHSDDSEVWSCLSQFRDALHIPNPWDTSNLPDSDKATNPLDVRCSQIFAPDRPAAPSLPISYQFCSNECGGINLSQPDKPTQWSMPFMQFIVPAVVFSMAIPRAKRLRLPDAKFDFYKDQ